MGTSHVTVMVVATLLPMAPLLGQDDPPTVLQDALPTILEGYVVDGGTGLPVPNVLIRAESGIETLSGEEGEYRMEGLPPGIHRLVLVTSRCNVSWATVTLVPEEIRMVVFQVPPEASSRTEDSEDLAREWRGRATGTVVTAAEIEAMHAPTMLEVIRRIAPGMVGGEGQVGATPTLRSRSMVSGQGLTEPVVVVDGVVVDGARSLGHIHPSEVETLEILKSAAGGWTYGSRGSGGVIRVTTKRGEEGHWHASPRRCVIPLFGSTAFSPRPAGRVGSDSSSRTGARRSA